MPRRLLSLWLPPLLLLNGPPALDNYAAPADPLIDLALWCQQYSPLTAIDPPDGILIDITGCAHLFGGEAGLRRHIASRLPESRSAIADTAAAKRGMKISIRCRWRHCGSIPSRSANCAGSGSAGLENYGFYRGRN